MGVVVNCNLPKIVAVCVVFVLVLILPSAIADGIGEEQLDENCRAVGYSPDRKYIVWSKIGSSQRRMDHQGCCLWRCWWG